MRQNVTEGLSIAEVEKASYKMNQKKWLYYLFILLFSLSSLAEEAVFDEEDFFIKLSVDNNLTSSQDAATNLAFSAISGLAYLGNNSRLCDNLEGIQEQLCEYSLFGALSYGAIMVTLQNHERSGHAQRVWEFGGTINETHIDWLRLSGYVSYNLLKPLHLQTQAIVSLGGMQADYLLSQKISDNLALHKQKIDPITSVGYVFSAADQLEYNYVSFNKGEDGHDLADYVKMMEAMYGDKSMSLDTLKYHGFLSLFNPMLLASIYSTFTGKSVDVPVLNINNIGIMPFARSIFTPYGVIEKKFGAYILTDYTPIRIGFSIGQQFKTNKPKDFNRYIEYCKYFDCGGNNSPGIFTGLKEGEAIERHMTYSFDISVFKLFNYDKLNVGATAAFWRQPELFVQDPYREKPKNGFMFTINSSYEASKDFNILCNMGYKSKGFIPGQRINQGFNMSLALEYKM